jgi:hypothetical protein
MGRSGLAFGENILATGLLLARGARPGESRFLLTANIEHLYNDQ